jgi:hypothetical protein
MGLLRFVEGAEAQQGFGSTEFRKEFKRRPHISKVRLDEDASAAYIASGKHMTLGRDAMGTEYAAAVNLTFELLLTVYDVDNSLLAAYRFVRIDPKAAKLIKGFFNGRGARQLEARIYGLQNGSDASGLNDAIGFVREIGAELCEIDVFGDSVRNVAVDVKRGMSFDILMLNRLYKQGELLNTMTKEQFERGMLQASQGRA